MAIKYTDREAYNMGYFAGKSGYSCLRPVGVTLTASAKRAYLNGWDKGQTDMVQNTKD